MTSGQAPPQPQSPPASQHRPGHVRWRRHGLAGGTFTAVIAGIAHLAGGPVVLIASAAAGLAGLGLWRYPHLRRHFASPHGRRNPLGRLGRLSRQSRQARAKTGRTAGRAGKGLRMPGSGAGRRGGSGGKTRLPGLGRKSGAGAGPRSGRGRGGLKLPSSGARRKTAAGPGRALGSARKRSGSASGSRSASRRLLGRSGSRGGQAAGRRSRRAGTGSGGPGAGKIGRLVRARKRAAAAAGRPAGRAGGSVPPGRRSRVRRVLGHRVWPAGAARRAGRRAGRAAHARLWPARGAHRPGATRHRRPGRRWVPRFLRRRVRRTGPRRTWQQWRAYRRGSGPRPGMSPPRTWRTRLRARIPGRRRGGLPTRRAVRRGAFALLLRHSARMTRRIITGQALAAWFRRRRRPPRRVASALRGPARLLNRPARRLDRWRMDRWRTRAARRRYRPPAPHVPHVAAGQPAWAAQARPGSPLNPHTRAASAAGDPPSAPGGRGTPSGGNRMAHVVTGFHSRVEAVAQSAEESLGSWEPEGGLEVAEAIGGIPDLFARLQAVFTGLGDKMGDGPFEAAARDAFHEASVRVGGLQDEFQHAHQVFENAHQVELDRLRNPRPRESMWDTTSN